MVVTIINFFIFFYATIIRGQRLLEVFHTFSEISAVQPLLLEGDQNTVEIEIVIIEQ